jgi:hypothetical protein
MSGPNSYMPPPPPQTQQGTGATWMPPPPPLTAPPGPMGQRFSPESLGHRLPWGFLAFISQSFGLLLVFLGALVVVIIGVVPPNCYNGMTCTGSTAAGILWGVMIARVLLVLGLFGLAAGAGLQLQFRPGPSMGASTEETTAFVARRRGEFFLLALCIVLLFAVVVWAAVVPTTIP